VQLVVEDTVVVVEVAVVVIVGVEEVEGEVDELEEGPLVETARYTPEAAAAMITITTTIARTVLIPLLCFTYN